MSRKHSWAYNKVSMMSLHTLVSLTLWFKALKLCELRWLCRLTWVHQKLCLLPLPFPLLCGSYETPAFVLPPLTVLSPTSRSWCYPTTSASVFLSSPASRRCQLWRWYIEAELCSPFARLLQPHPACHPYHYRCMDRQNRLSPVGENSCRSFITSAHQNDRLAGLRNSLLYYYII